MNKKYIFILLAIFLSSLTSACEAGSSDPEPIAAVTPDSPPPPASPPESDVPVSVFDSSIAGDDSDGNDIRDDIDQLLEGTFASSSAELSLATKYATNIQKMITMDLSADIDERKTPAIEAGINIYCGTSLYGSGFAAQLKQLKFETINNEARQAAIEAYNKSLSGHLFSPLSGISFRSLCEED